MHIRERVSGEMVILHVEGDLLCEAEQELLRGRVKNLASAGKRNLIIDLSGIRYINSCGLGSLVSAFTTLKRSGGNLKICGAGGHVRELFDITHLDRVFPLYATSKEALAG